MSATIVVKLFKKIRSFAAKLKPQLEPTIMNHRHDVGKYAISNTLGVTQSITYLQNCLVNRKTAIIVKLTIHVGIK